MYEVGISTCSKVINEKLFEDFAKNNIKHAEISETGYDEFDFRYVKEMADRFGVNLWSLHLPFVTFDKIEPSSLDKDVRESTIRLFSELIKKGSDIGIDKFIIHPSGEPIEDLDRDEKMKYSCESMSRLAEVAEKCGAVICVEDLPRTCLGHSSSEMLTLLNADMRLKACFDTNHITVQKPEDVIKDLGDRIITLHVSDFDFVNERHWLPGEGQINWNNILDALEEINYKGVFMYEIGFACPKTILRDRDLSAADFDKNAKELFSRQKPTVFSSPKPNLGMWE